MEWRLFWREITATVRGWVALVTGVFSTGTAAFLAFRAANGEVAPPGQAFLVFYYSSWAAFGASALYVLYRNSVRVATVERGHTVRRAVRDALAAPIIVGAELYHRDVRDEAAFLAWVDEFNAWTEQCTDLLTTHFDLATVARMEDTTRLVVQNVVAFDDRHRSCLALVQHRTAILNELVRRTETV